jgi:hypothetical protein
MDNKSGMVLRAGVFSMQVCVPKGWTDKQVEEFANEENPTGTSSDWKIRRQGDPALHGTDERVQWSGDGNLVHIVLDC